MKYSIIVPLYNIEKYISICIESVLEQTYVDYELILINDGSTDDSLSKCQKYTSDNRVKIISQENKGAAFARNVGMQVSKGEYLLFLDGDDYFADKNCLESLSKDISKDIDVCLFNYATDYLGKISKVKGYKNKKLYDSGMDYFDTNVDTGCVSVSLWLGVYRREYIIENELMLKNKIIAEDIDWYLRIYSLNARILTSNETICIHRINTPGSLTYEISEKKIICYYDLLCDWINYPYVDDSQRNIYYNYLAYQYCILLSIMNNRNTNKHLKKKIYNFNFLLEYTRDFRVARISKVNNYIGFNGTVIISRIYRRMRKSIFYRITNDMWRKMS